MTPENISANSKFVKDFIKSAASHAKDLKESSAAPYNRFVKKMADVRASRANAIREVVEKCEWSAMDFGESGIGLC